MKEFLLKNINHCKFKDLFWIILLFLVALTVTLPIHFLGMTDAYDLPQHFQFAQTYYDSILSGDFFPSWSANTNHGFGDIGIRFYPPLGYYILSFAKIITGNWYDAGWLSLIFWMFLSLIGVYFLSKELLSPVQSAIAASIYAIIPYHLSQIYHIFLYAEFAASAILPFCFLFVIRICRRGKPIDILCLTIFYALLILSHIPSTIFGSIILVLFAAAVSFGHNFFKTAFKISLSLIGGLLASSFHWIKIITEMSWLNHISSQFFSDTYDFHQFFFPSFQSSLSGFVIINNAIRYRMSILTIALMIPLIIWLFLSRNDENKDSPNRKIIRGTVITGLFAYFMSTSLSNFIWEIFPVLQKIQFPFRWLSIVSIIGSVSFVLGISRLIERKEKTKRLIIYSAILIIFCISLFDITQLIAFSNPIPRKDFGEKLGDLRNKESYDCWWTIWSSQKAFDNKEKVSAGLREIKINIWDKENREFEIEDGEPSDARVATFYYPYWKAEVNGKPVELQKLDDGTISVPINETRSTVKIFFREPLLIKFSFILSALCWLSLLIGIFRLILTNSKLDSFLIFKKKEL